MCPFDAMAVCRYNAAMEPWQGNRGRRAALRYDQEAFEAIVADALEGLPDEIHAWLDNVVIVVAEQPTQQHLAQARVRRSDLLLGLYVGVPKIHRGVTFGESLPDKIVIFQRPIEQLCRTPDEIRAQVRRTVLHEIGHHFGMEEGQLRDAGV